MCNSQNISSFRTYRISKRSPVPLVLKTRRRWRLSKSTPKCRCKNCSCGCNSCSWRLNSSLPICWPARSRPTFQRSNCLCNRCNSKCRICRRCKRCTNCSCKCCCIHQECWRKILFSNCRSLMGLPHKNSRLKERLILSKKVQVLEEKNKIQKIRIVSIHVIGVIICVYIEKTMLLNL